MDCDLDEADMGMPIMNSLNILVTNYQNLQSFKGEEDE
jgi:hypothetical protein